MYTCYIQKFQASVAEQAGLNVTWTKISEDPFSRDVAHFSFVFQQYPQEPKYKIKDNFYGPPPEIGVRSFKYIHK